MRGVGGLGRASMIYGGIAFPSDDLHCDRPGPVLENTYVAAIANYLQGLHHRRWLSTGTWLLFSLLACRLLLFLRSTLYLLPPLPPKAIDFANRSIDIEHARMETSTMAGLAVKITTAATLFKARAAAS